MLVMSLVLTQEWKHPRDHMGGMSPHLRRCQATVQNLRPSHKVFAVDKFNEFNLSSARTHMYSKVS